MASIDVAKMAASSRMAGLKNYGVGGTGSIAIPSLGLNAGDVGNVSFTIPLARTNAITSFRILLDGIETQWRVVKGSIQVDKPNLPSWEYSIVIQGYYSGSNFICDIYIVNQAGFFVVTPAFTVRGEVDTFVAPF